jgi:ribosome biogenesis GTPase
VQKGRHTTVTAQLVPLECGGYVADTPGLRELGLWGIPEEELDRCFPEFEPYLGECRYRNSCTHTHEPGCAVRAAVEGGEVSASRYDSYARMRAGEEDSTEA